MQPSRTLPWTLMPARFPRLVTLLALTGCGDSLVSGTALELMLDMGRVPERPGWVQLWVDEGGEGIVVSCEVMPVPRELIEDSEDTLVIDRLEVPPPDWAEPVAWTEHDEFSWALALHLLVDRDRLDFLDAAEALEFGEVEDIPGVWGMADTLARLHGEGDTEALGDTIIAGQVPPELDDDGRAGVGFANEIVAATGTFEGALAALDPDDQADLSEDGLPVRRLDTLDNASLLLLSGEPFGGLELAQDCDELFDLEDDDPEDDDPEDDDPEDIR